MKNCLVALLAVLCGAALAGPLGNETGNGGDGLAERFVQRGYVILSILRTGQPPQDLLTPAQLDGFENTLRTTRVAVIEGDLRDNQGVLVEARNVADPNRADRRIIQLKKSAWEKYLTQGDAHVYQLVFHEYLLVLGVDDANYVLSHRLSVQPANGSSLAIRTCGLSGTIEERVLNCARPADQGGFGDLAVKVLPTADEDNDALSAFDDNPYFVWRLVARTENRDQFWRDDASGAVWSDRSEGTFPYKKDASAYCSGVGAEIFHAQGGPGFFLPSQSQWEVAIHHQIRRALPRIAQRYWTYDSRSSEDTVFYGNLVDNPHPFFHYSDHPEIQTNYYGFYLNDYARCMAQ